MRIHRPFVVLNNVAVISRDRSAEFSESISHAAVPAHTLVKHTSKHGHVPVHVVIDPDLSLALMSPVKATGVLHQSPSPGNRHHQKQRVEACVIEPLTDESTGREDQSLLIVPDPGERLLGGTPIRRLHPPPASRSDFG